MPYGAIRHLIARSGPISLITVPFANYRANAVRHCSIIRLTRFRSRVSNPTVVMRLTASARNVIGSADFRRIVRSVLVMWLPAPSGLTDGAGALWAGSNCRMVVSRCSMSANKDWIVASALRT
jgi:hypothetical protein